MCCKETGSGNFYPDNNISRAEFIAMVVRAIGLEEQVVDGVFTDVPADSWYAGAVGAALEAGIISRDTTFRPDDPVTREEISKVVTGARRMVQTPQEVPQDYQLPYADNTLISEWAVGYVREASYLGLMNGRTQTEFDPQGNATRAEMAAVLSRMLSME